MRITKLYYKWIYFKYWLFNKNLLFDIFNKNRINQNLILNVDPKKIEYAIPWQIFLDKKVNVKNLSAPKNLDVNQINDWYRFVFYFDYNTPNICNVIGGTWDKKSFLARFDENLVYYAFKSVFKKNIRWEDTEYYNYFKKYIYNNKDALKARMEYNNYLFDEIIREGYKNDINPKENESLHPEYPLQLNQEIKIAIGRNNEMIFVDGNHRLSIAKILNCNEIVVRVVLIHPKCDLFKFYHH